MHSEIKVYSTNQYWSGRLRLGSNCSAYELIRFCRYLSTVLTAPFLLKHPDKKYPFLSVYTAHSNGGKNIRFYEFSFHNAVVETHPFLL